MKTKTKVLDCTLRDGGYYTNWDFDSELLASYFKAIDDSGIDFCEVGLRTPPKEKYLGAFAHCSDTFLKTLPLPKKCTIGVMVNATDYLCETPAKAKEVVNRFFTAKKDSLVGLVRIASHISDLKSSILIANELKHLGYMVGLNIMQIGNKTEEEVTNALKLVSSCESLDVLYFADSLGNMGSAEILNIVEKFQEYWKGELGIHAHNNCGRALDNTLLANSRGVSWLDSTITGMGRGAGNTQTEYLAIELKSKDREDLNAEALFPTVVEYFLAMKKEHGWGEGLFYFLAAKYQIHPTYVQELMGNGVYEVGQILKIIEGLKDETTTSYQKTLISSALNKKKSKKEGSWKAKSWCKGREVLLLANGPELKEHSLAITRFIQNRKPIVISLNLNKYISNDHIDYIAACTDTRLMLEYSRYPELKKKVILPLGDVPDYIQKDLEGIEILDYGKTVTEGEFLPHENYCSIPYSLVAPYCLSLGIAGEAQEIFLAGFDGYEPGSVKQNEMEDVFSLIEQLNLDCKITSLTNSTYSVNKQSVYSYEF